MTRQKTKTRVLWLYLFNGSYELYDKEPEWNEEYKWWEGNALYEFCDRPFERLSPSLKLRKNTKCKLKLTNLKNGIKLEKVK